MTRRLGLAALAAFAVSAALATPAGAYELNALWLGSASTNMGHTCNIEIAAGSAPYRLGVPVASEIGYFTWITCGSTGFKLPALYVSVEAYDANLPVADWIKEEATCANTGYCIYNRQRLGVQGRTYNIRGSASAQLPAIGAERFTSGTGGCVPTGGGLGFSCQPEVVGTLVAA